VLPAGSRIRAAADFNSVMRRGLKSGRATVVVYVALANGPARVAGFAVSKAVGGAVVRNQVKRRLRAIVAAELAGIPEGSAIVVRALPAAASAPFSQLAADVRSALALTLAKAAV
jgi:ribonuclease P protein component